MVRCGTVAPISAADQARAADELATLPTDGAVRSVLVPDHARMRREARACATAP